MLLLRAPCVFFALAFPLLFAPLALAYTDYSLSVHITLREDGTAHVTEQTVFSPDNSEEVRVSNALLSTARSVAELARLSENVKYHVGNASVPRSSIRITTRPAYEVSSTARSIILDYDLGQIVSNETRGRITEYQFSQDALSFEKTASRQMVLGPIMELSVEIPKDARISYSAGDRKNLAGPEPYAISGNTVSWSGKNIGQMVGFWFLQYEREIPLSQEVYDYFRGIIEKASASAPQLILAGLLGVVAFVLLRIGKNKPAAKE
ncbi:MAG: hypothetical protein WC792_05485 [Candidatus Micrarchaeia archaeon]